MGTWYPGRCPGLRTCWAFSPRRAADRAFLHNLHQPLIFLFCPLSFRSASPSRLPIPPIQSPCLLANLGRAAPASAPSDDRIWAERRPHLGRATTVSAPRCGRALDGVRRQVVNLDFSDPNRRRKNPSTPYINNKQTLNIALSACLLLLCGKHVPSRRLVPAEREPYYFLWASTQRRALTKASIHGVTSSARRSAG